MSALVVKDLHVTLSGSHILQGVSFEIPENKVTALLGRNGVGKTTTLISLMGMYPASGSISFFGEEIRGEDTYKIVRKGIGYVPEDREIFAGLTVAENLELAERDKSPNYELVYSLFPELKDRGKQRAGTLSGGQQQMVSISRSLLNKNRLLVIDEPTKGLAPKLVSEVAAALTTIAGDTTMLLVEQNLSLVKATAQHLLVMDQGKIIFQGDPVNLQNEEWVHSMVGVGKRALS